MKIYIVRHGETDWNAQKRLQGHVDIDINEHGIKLAKLTGEALKDVPFSVVYTSPLMRARHTARLILNGRDVPVVEDERLMEISFGEYEGLKYRISEREVPDPDFQNFFDAPHLYHTPPNGESLQELEKRTADFMKELCGNDKLEDKVILVSTHGCALRGLLNSLRENTVEDFWHGKVAGNCSVSIVESHHGNPVLKEENRIFYKE